MIGGQLLREIEELPDRVAGVIVPFAKIKGSELSNHVDPVQIPDGAAAVVQAVSTTIQDLIDNIEREEDHAVDHTGSDDDTWAEHVITQLILQDLVDLPNRLWHAVCTAPVAAQTGQTSRSVIMPKQAEISGLPLLDLLMVAQRDMVSLAGTLMAEMHTVDINNNTRMESDRSEQHEEVRTPFHGIMLRAVFLHQNVLVRAVPVIPKELAAILY